MRAVFDWIFKSELVVDLTKSIVRVFAHEGDSWGGRADLALVILVFALLLLPRPFQFIASVITVLIERFIVGARPTPFGRPGRSVTKDALLLIGGWLVSVLTVWAVRL